MEYSDVIESIIPPIEPAALLPSPIAIYQRPNIIPIFVAGTNLETYDKPTGDKLNLVGGSAKMFRARKQ